MLAASAHGAKPIWAGGSGDGNNGQNWERTQSPPGQTDIAHVGKGTAEYNVNSSIGALELTKDPDATEPGKIGGSAKVTFIGGTNLASIWDSGEMTFTSSGGVIFDAAASLTIQTTNSHKLSGGSLTNKGSTSWTGGSLDISNGATLTNDATGIFATTFDGVVTNTGGATFTNSGQFKKTAGTGGQTEIQPLFQNTGALVVDSGKLKLTGGGSSTGTSTSTSNIVDIADGATLQVATTSYSFTGTNLNASGANKTGVVDVNGTTATFSGTSGSANVSVTGGGSAAFAGSHSGTGKLSLSSGSVTTSDTNVATFNSLEWKGGEIHGKVVATGAAASVSDVGTKTIGSSGELTVVGGTTSVPSTWSGTGVITNQGKLTHTSGETYIATTFTNTGTLTASSGTLKLSGGGTSSGTGNAVSVGTGGKLHVSSNYTFDGTSFTGAGTVEVGGATSTIKGATGAGKFAVSGGNADFSTSGSSATSLTLSSGIVSSTNGGSATVGSLAWTGGSLNGKVTSSGTTIGSGGTKSLSGGDVTFGGTTTWDGSAISANSSAKLKNTGTFTASGDGTLSNTDSTAAFTNEGAFRKSGGTGTTELQAALTNTGTIGVDDNTGTLKLSGGGSSNAAGNRVDVGDGAKLQISTTDFSFSGTTLNASGASKNGVVEINSAKGHFSGTTTGSVNLSVAGGTANFGGVHQGTGKLSVSLGSVEGSGSAEFNGLDWSGGTVNANVTSRGASTISGGAKNLGAALALHGTTDWDGSLITATGTAQVRNEETGTFRANGNGTLANSGNATFTNAGTFEKTGTGTSTTIGVPLRNEKSVFVRSGSLILSGGTHSVAGAGIEVTDGAQLHLSGGVTLEANATNASLLKGQGLARLLGGSLDANGRIDISQFNFEGGQLTGTNSFAGTINWLGGHWNASGPGSTTTIESVLNMAQAAAHEFDYREVINNGMVTWQSNSLRGGNGSSFKNQNVFFDQNPGASRIEAGTGAFTFTNAGTYHKSGTGVTTVAANFENKGTLLITHGTIVFSNAFANAGHIHLLNGAAAEFAQPFSFGPTETLSGVGTIRAPKVTAAGFVSPGVSPGMLTVTGDLTLLETSTLLIELGAAAHDFLSVGGTLAVGATAPQGPILRVHLLDGFASVVQPTFTVLTAGTIAPNFSFFNVPNGQRLFTFDGLGSFQVNYGPGSAFSSLTNSVVLSDFVAVPEPSTYVLLGLGASIVLFTVRRTKRKTSSRAG